MRACLCRILPIALLLLACVIARHGWAAEPSACGPDVAGSPCGEEQVAGLPATGGAPQGVGNPVNLITGNKHQRETDMAALPGALGLELVRHYNSELARPGMPLHGIGRGWQFSYDTRLHAEGRALRIVQADGARRVFTKSALSATLFASANPAEGMVRIARDDSVLHYRWRWPDGRELGFDRNGRLRRIMLPSGEALAIARLADGRLATVTDPQGRSLTFHYLAQAGLRPGRLSAIRHVDTPVGRILYDYGDATPGGLRQQAENLIAVHLPTHHEPGRLRSLDGRGDRPSDYSRSSLRRRYHYEDPRFPAFLTGISVTGAGGDDRQIDQRIARWAYDRNGLAVLSASGKAAQDAAPGSQPHAGAGLIMLDRCTPGRTTLTDGDGRVTIYRHAIVNGAFRLLEARGDGCEGCGPVNLRYGYDRLGRLQEVTRLDAHGKPVEGRREERDAWGRTYASKTVQYAHGRETSRTLVLRQLYRPAGIAAVAPGTSPATSLPASQHGPKQVAMPSVLAGHDHRTVIEYNQRQQALAVTETGYHPADGSMQARTTRYRYAEIAGRSLLSEIDGPLPNGPAGSPADSDITRYEWDARGAHVRRVRHPMGAISEMDYDPHTGRLAVLTLRWERTVRQLRYAYDPLGQVEQVRERALDADGVTVLAERELGLRWNALGRPSALVEADGTVRELEEGEVAGTQAFMASATSAISTISTISTISAPSATSTTSKTSMTSAAMPAIAAARARAPSLAGAAASPALAVPGMLPPAGQTNASVAAPNALWPTQYGDPLTAAAHEALRFDANGRSAERRIDDFGQVVAIRNPGQGWQHARYDEAGRLVEIRDARAAITLARYDAAGRLLRVERTMPGELPEQVDITWRGPERLTETVNIAGHQTHATHYRHAPWGQVSQMQVDIAGSEGGAPVRMSLQSRYDSAGRLISRTLPGGERLAWRYYAGAPYRGQQAGIEQIHWPVWLDALMTRLPETWLDRWRWKTRIAVFAPREADQALTAASGAAALPAMTAGGAGGAGPTAWAGRAPQVEPGLSTQVPGADHDAAGLPHRLSAPRGELLLRWNAASQLSEVGTALNAGQSESQPVARYRYDARGRRASKHTTAGDEYYLYEGTQLIAAVNIDPKGRRSLNQYLYEGYRAVAWLREGVAHALQTDSRGALSEVRSLADDGKPAQTLWRAELDAWGNRPKSAPSSPHDPGLRLVNQYADGETGLSYHIARYYDPSQGRFLSPDPAGIADTLSANVPPALRLDLTAYVAGQPWHYIDPDGAARLIYYALTTDAKGKQLGVSQGFTRARWAFSIDGIEASGDGGSDAINQLMEKYAKNQTGLLFDGGGDYLTGGKKAVSWNGAADETVDGFRKHYGKNLIGLPNFTIGNFSNRDAALLVAGFSNNSDESKLCVSKNLLLPPIKFSPEDIPITPTDASLPQRLLNCGDAEVSTSTVEDLRKRKFVKLNQAISINEVSQIYKDCSVKGCPSNAGIFIDGARNFVDRVPAAYSHLQFAPETLAELLVKNLLNKKFVEKNKIDQKDLDSIFGREINKQDIIEASSRAKWIYVYGRCMKEEKNPYEGEGMRCPSKEILSTAWDDLKDLNKSYFSERTGLSKSMWEFLKKNASGDLVSNTDYVRGTNETEIIDAAAWAAWDTVESSSQWFKALVRDNAPGGLMEKLAVIYFRIRESQLISYPDFGLKYDEEKLYPLAYKKSSEDQNKIDLEMAMRLARRHNGGTWWLSLSRLKSNDPKDYVKKISGDFKPEVYGNFPSLRCVSKNEIQESGVLMIRLNLD